MKRFLSFSLFVLALASGLAAQSKPYEIRRPCPNSTTFATVTIDKSGNVTVTPCSGKTATATSLVASNAKVANQAWALNFSGISTHVKLGTYYTPNTDYHTVPDMWEAWIKPSTTAFTGYWAVNGYGGQHTLLVGTASNAGRAAIVGNFHNGTNTNGYGSNDTSPAGGWAHHAVIYLPQDQWAAGNPASPTVCTYINGALSSVTTLTNPRINSGTTGTGNDDFEIGGTDHSNYTGEIAEVGSFSNGLPFATPATAVGGCPALIYPERSFRGGFYQNSDSVRVARTLLYDFRNNTGSTIPDLGVGYNGGTHSGVLAKDYTSMSLYSEPDNYTTGIPTWVNDPIAKLTETITVPSAPSNAVLYDTFSRQDVVPAWATTFTNSLPTLGLGNLEKPSGRAWSASSAGYAATAGIINGRAFQEGPNGNLGFYYSAVGSADMDVRAHSGDAANWTSIPTAIARYTDTTHYVYAYVANGGATLYSGTISGVDVVGNTDAWPGGTDTIRINCVSTTCSVYANNTLVRTYTGVTLVGQNAGFQLLPLNRIDLFEVY